MNQRILTTGFVICFAIISMGFIFKGKSPDESMPKVPTNMPNHSIGESPLHQRLVKSYGHGLTHERIKIDYLVQEVKSCPFTFVRNGLSYDGKKTAKHLLKKYRKRVAEIRSARQFIDEIATKSSMSGKRYLADTGDGHVYYAANLLYYELDRVEAYLKDYHLKQVNEVTSQVEKIQEVEALAQQNS